MPVKSAEAFDISFDKPARARPPPKLSRSGGARPASGGLSRARAGSFDDGGGRTSTPIRPRTVTTTSSTSKVFERGQAVKVKKPPGKPGYREATIEKKNADGTYDVMYDDNLETERGVRPIRIHDNSGVSNTPVKSSAADDSDFATPSRKTIGRSRMGLDDSDAEDQTYSVGEKVEARFGGGAAWYKGVISRANRDGTYAIDYDDGDREPKVPTSMMRKVGGKLLKKDPFDDSDAEGVKFERGDKVEARVRGRWLPGRVLKANRDGTYDIRFDGGDVEYGLPAPTVRAAGGPSSPLKKSPFDDSELEDQTYSVGEKVEARFGGGAAWYKGVISRANRDGTYAIDYDDGDREPKVPTSMMRKVGGKLLKKDPFDDSDAEGVKFERGDKVEARLRGRWLPGRVLKANRDGTYDIRFDGGDVEYGLPAPTVRAAGGPSSPLKKSPFDDSELEDQTYSVGEKVEARFGGGAAWYKGVISRANRDGTYAIDYDDGDREPKVPTSMMRKVGGKLLKKDPFDDSDAEGVKFERGDKVEARLRGRWLPGRVLKANRDGTYDIRFDGGDVEYGLPAPTVRAAGGPSSPLKKSPFDDSELEDQTYSVGEKVEARFGGGAAWYKGVISRANRDGTYAIDYDDGDREPKVPTSMMRKVGGKLLKKDPFDDSDAEGVKFERGDKVEARVRGRWLPGRVLKANRDGTYDIRFDGGDVEYGLPAPTVRAAGGPSSPLKKSPFDDSEFEDQTFSVGEKVEARFGGGAAWYKGVISRANRDGTYAIDYDDGDREPKVPTSMMRKVGGKLLKKDPFDDSDAEGVKFERGDKVEARLRGRWLPGRVLKANRDGTYDIRFDGGDVEYGLPAPTVRAAGGRSKSPHRKDPFDDSELEDQTYSVGEKVEARFGGGAAWYKGVISRANRDGTYAIDYDDGDREPKVPTSMMRKVGGKLLKKDPFDDSDAEGVKFERGDKVEARLRGRWLPGRVLKANRDGTYDIRFDGGDVEYGLPAPTVRAAGGRSKSPHRKDSFESELEDQTYSVGEKVEARFGGGAAWYKGVISRANRDGTYAIDYDDGDREPKVPTSMMRKVGGKLLKKDPFDDSDAEGVKFERGDKVEARLRGRWLPGRVLKANRDGTYDIRFDGGDVEYGLPAPTVRAAGGRSKSPHRKDSFESELEDQTYSVGEKVEARFGGGAAWYKGVISRANRDGTYAIDYDDGDREPKVPTSMMRKVGGKLLKKDPFDDSDAEGVKFERGDKVEARLRGRWLPGRVLKANRDGTYDIRFDGGDVEYGLPAPTVRAAGGRSKSPHRKDSFESELEDQTYSVGEKVEARFGGGAAWYKGVISRANRDGTYAIDYDDGDREPKVPTSMMRKVGGKLLKKDPFDDSDAEDQTYSVGEKVEARFGGGAAWYKGVISRANRDGTYAIDYDDGDREPKVPTSMMRKVGGKLLKKDPFDDSDAEGVKFERGDKVEARLRGRWLPGRVLKANRNGTYDIRFDGGDVEYGLPAPTVRAAGGRSKSPHRKDSFESELEDQTYSVGEKVEARFGGGAAWYKGVISRANRDGTYAIDYDDGDREPKVPTSMMRKVGGKLLKKDPFDDSDAEGVKFERGDKVEARLRGRWLPGRVLKANRDGTYDIRFDGGDVEYGLPAPTVRAAGGRSKSPHRKDSFESELEDQTYSVGEKVEARFGGGAAWYKGVISRANRDGTYAIDYDDGDREPKVPTSMMRKVGGKLLKKDPFDDSDAEGVKFERGDKVEARLRGRWLPGRVLKANRDGTYDIRFDGGDVEYGLPAPTVRAAGGRSKSPHRKDSFESELEDQTYSVGEKVEARFGGGAAWYKGVISRANRDGTYAIDYDDGDREPKVPTSMMRKVGGKLLKKDPFDDSDAEDQSYSVGDKVEARFGGGAAWYKGVISRANRDGTYAIDYDDGDREPKVPTSMMRKVGGKLLKKDPFDDSDAEGVKFERGDKVEARLRGRWLPGRVLKANRDGTYDIRFDGGDVEYGLPAPTVRAAGGRSKSPHRKDPFDDSDAEDQTYSVGEKVEARFGGGAAWYKGVISRANRDGTYAIDYDDGDREPKVPTSMMRKVGGKLLKKDPFDDSDAEGVKFERGDKVEARLRGRWLPGRVLKANRDGTYDIRFDGGDEEYGLPAPTVRAAGGRSKSPHRKDPFDDSELEDQTYSVGEKVEARFGGGAAWYKGVISRANRDGTYAIDYDDGDREPKVPTSMMRKVGGKLLKKDPFDDSDAEGVKFERGDKVEARVRGRWLPGRVLKANRDGTYDIRFESGNEVEGIANSGVRAVDQDNREYRRRDNRVKVDKILSAATVSSLRRVVKRYCDKSVDSTARSCFASMDHRNSGVVTKREFKTGLREVYDVGGSKSVAFSEWISAEDMGALTTALSVPSNHSNADGGSISYDAFVAFALDEGEDSELTELQQSLQDGAFKRMKYKFNVLTSLFEKYDKHHKGFIRLGEFMKVIRKFYPSLSSREENLLKSRVDMTGEGIVDYFGFVWWLGIGEIGTEELMEKFRNQMRMLDEQALEDALKGEGRTSRSRDRGINCDRFEDAMSTLGAVLTSREIKALFSELCKEHGYRDDSSVLSVEEIISSIEKERNKKRSKASRGGGMEDSCLLPQSLLTDIEQATAAFLSASRASLSTALSEFGSGNKDGSDDVRRSRTNIDKTSTSSFLTKAKFSKALEHIGCQLLESDCNLLFESLDVSSEGVVSVDDLLLFSFSLSQGTDATAEAGAVLQLICSKRRITAKDFVKNLAPHDRKRRGYVDAASFESVLKKLGGSRPGVSSTQLAELLRFFDPNQEDTIDIGVVRALVMACTIVPKAEEKLKHILRVMRIKEIDYKSMFADCEKKMDLDEVVQLFSRMRLPITEAELYCVIGKLSSREKVNIPVMLEKLETDDSKSGKRYSRLLGGKKAETDSKDYDFGKNMFRKLCTLRADLAKKDRFREAIMGRDPDLNGRITIRDLQRTTDNFLDLTEAESNLLTENLCFVDGNFKKDIDYSLLLLILHEPLTKSRATVEAGTQIMEKMLRGSDSVSLRRLMALLFRNFAATDDRVSGMVTIGNAEAALKEEVHGVEFKLVRRVVKAFQDENSDCVLYPELLSFLGCCSLWNVMYRLHLVDRIRKKQGYNFGEFLVKYTAKHGKKLSREKTSDLFLSIGMLVPETALETIFNTYGDTEGTSIDAKKFSKGLADVESTDDDDGAPQKKERKEISEWEGSGLTEDGQCKIQEELLKKYDARMLNVIQLAFDIFDQNATNQIASLDIERVLCALGQKPSPKDIEDLLNATDPNDTGVIEYNVFMDHVIPYIRSKYKDTFALSFTALREAFNHFDINHDGTVSASELRYILTMQNDDITAEECDTVLEYIDTNGNGVIEWVEFAELHALTRDDDAMLRLSVPLRYALRKLQYSVLPDPEKHLSMFAGLPANYRLSVLADIEKDPSHSLGRIVCPSKYLDANLYLSNIYDTDGSTLAPKQFDFSVQILRVTGVPTETPKRRANIVNRCARFAICKAEESEYEGQWLSPTFRGNVMKLHGSVNPKKLDMWHFSNEDEIDPDKTCFVRCTVDDADHRSNIENNVSGKNLYLFMELVSTVRVDEEDYRTISAAMKASRSEMAAQLKREKEEKKRKEKEEKKKKEKLKSSTLFKKSHIDGDIRFSTEKLKRASKKNATKETEKEDTGKKDTKDDDESDDEDEKNVDVDEEIPKDEPLQEAEEEGWSDEDYMTVEMSAGWVMIPISNTISSMGTRKTTKITLDMSGGTPFCVVGIQKGDVPRRQGLLETIKRVVGIKIHSKLEFLISTATQTEPNLLQPLPQNIIIPAQSVSAVGVYRHYLADTIREQELQSQIERILPQSGRLPTGDPIFSSFPRILNDPAACRVLLLLWRMEAPKSVAVRSSHPTAQAKAAPSSPAKKKEDNTEVSGDALFVTPSKYTLPARCVSVFRNIVLRVWRAMACPDARPPRTVMVESVKSLYRRELKIRSLVGITKTPAALANTAHMKEIKENSKSNALRASVGKSDRSVGKSQEFSAVTQHLSVDALSNEHVAHAPFNVRELVWGNDNYL